MSQTQSNMSFSVNRHAIVYNMLNGEILGILASRNDEQKKELYKEKGIIESSPAIIKFMGRHKEVFGNRKLIYQNGNFFGGIVPLSPLSETESYKDMLKSRMKYEYDISDEELLEMDGFIEDLENLHRSTEIKPILDETIEYKNSIERLWKANESRIMKHIKGILGSYTPKNVGKVNVYVMYPNIDTHRSCPVSDNKTYSFFGKRGERNPSKILAYLTHQAVHQPMLPYTPSMTRDEKENFHAFIKFLTDKEIYSSLTGRSYLDIETVKENPNVMGKVYPFWLGYRYRNIDKQGLNPVEEIRKAIKRDKDYFDSLPQKSRKRKLFESYEFEKIDADKLSTFFKARRGITPYEFARLDFEDKTLVYKDEYLKKKSEDVDFYDV